MAETAIPTPHERALPRMTVLRRIWRRIKPDNIGTTLIVMLMSAVILVNGSSLLFFLVFRDNAAVAAAAGQAADQLIAISRMLDRARPEDRLLLIRRLNSPVLGMVITKHPLVGATDDQLPSRVVQRRLAREFPRASEIRVSSRFDSSNLRLEGFPSDEEIRRHMRGDADAEASGNQELVPPDYPRPIDEPRLRGEGGPPNETQLRRRWDRWFGQPGSIDGVAPDAVIRVSTKFADDDVWFNARVALVVEATTERTRTFFIQAAISVLIAVVALWGLRRATRPLAMFVGAAERLGVDVNAEPLSEEGPGEVRRAAHTFNTMQTRIKRFIQDRTQMLAAISHDLRTPITRMKLRAEFVDDDEQREKMLKDLNEMEAMIATTLSFARDDAANEATRTADVAHLLATLASDFRQAGSDVTYVGPDTLEISARPMALKRALTNLVDNAIKYGKRARVSLRQGGGEIEIAVDDDGPGIPTTEMERVFSPFYRIEGSRSRETGGTGLGLTITRNAIRSMGGDVELSNRAGGGLRARVILPVASAGSAFRDPAQ